MHPVSGFDIKVSQDLSFRFLFDSDLQVLIFSQMTSMMDIIEDYCIMRNYGYSRLDGQMKVSDRQQEVCLVIPTLRYTWKYLHLLTNWQTIADSNWSFRGSQLVVVRSSAIIWKHTFTISCDRAVICKWMFWDLRSNHLIICRIQSHIS